MRRVTVTTAAVIDRRWLRHEIVDVGAKPYDCAAFRASLARRGLRWGWPFTTTGRAAVLCLP
jgi:hypothetical protein